MHSEVSFASFHLNCVLQESTLKTFIWSSECVVAAAAASFGFP